MQFAWGLSAVALLFGLVLGARGLVDPGWAARLVRLREDEQGGGFAEFRAMYGGLFVGLHAVALYLVTRWMLGGDVTTGVLASGACAAVSASWAGAAFGRGVSIWRDKGADTPFNRSSALVEAGVALCVGLPWIVWLLGAGS